jgi:spermidine/putrescine transport system ATP-binding protein
VSDATVQTPAQSDAATSPSASPAQPIQGDSRKAAGDAVVSLEHVVKRFGNVAAVDDLTLEIKRGEFFSMLGPSGCGKTTTLRLIGGFEVPTEGVVRLDGRDVTDLPAFRRDVNTVFQSYGLFPHFNVFDNVALSWRNRQLEREATS